MKLKRNKIKLSFICIESQLLSIFYHFSGKGGRWNKVLKHIQVYLSIETHLLVALYHFLGDFEFYGTDELSLGKERHCKRIYSDKKSILFFIFCLFSDFLILQDFLHFCSIFDLAISAPDSARLWWFNQLKPNWPTGTETGKILFRPDGHRECYLLQ